MPEPRPRFAYNWRALAQVAAFLHAEAVKRYPAMVEAGKVPRAKAEADTRAREAVAADWRAAVDRTAPPAETLATRAEKIAALETAAARYAERSARDPGNVTLEHLAACIAALLWWARHPLGISGIVEFNRAARLRWPQQSARAAA